MRLPSSSRLLVAAAGVLVGHAAAYAIPHDGGHAHDAVHGYLHLLAPLLAPLALMAMLRLTAAEARRCGSLRLGGLVGLQMGLFGTMETLERLASGAPFADLLTSPALWIGLAAQVVVASLVAGGVRLTGRAVRQLRRPRTVGVAPHPAGLAPIAAALRPAATPVVAFLRRGPPLRA